MTRIGNLGLLETERDWAKGYAKNVEENTRKNMVVFGVLGGRH